MPDGIQQDKDCVLQTTKEHDIKFVSLWFTDVLGFLKGFTITVEELEAALEDGMGFDGSSIEGFARINESDMVAMPDSDTFQLIPWSAKDDKPTARMFCDILNPGGEPFQGDPRYVLKRNLKRAADMDSLPTSVRNWSTSISRILREPRLSIRVDTST